MSFRLGRLPLVPPSLVAAVVFLAAPPPYAGSRVPSKDSVQRAKQLAWLNNWTEAARVLDALKRSGRLGNDDATTFFARAVEIRGNVETLSLPSAAADLADIFASDVSRKDLNLRLQILAMKGDIEFQYDLAAAEKTWTEVRRLASTVGHRGWEARAGGELGTIAFLNGEVFTALKMVVAAYFKAEMSGDTAAQIKQLTALGEGLAEFGRPADAIRFFDKALALASANPDVYFPFTAYLGKARLLLASEKATEGRQMLSEGLAEAQREGMKVRETRIMTVLGDDALRTGDRAEAVKWLMCAAAVGRRAGLHRTEADAGSKLASVLSETGEFDQAAKYARVSVLATERASDIYHLPQRLAALGEIETKRGSFASAEAAYARATQLVNSLLTDLPNPRHENTLIATMGHVFEGHFELALNRLHDLDRAFEILESARARGLVDRIRERELATHIDGPSDPQMLPRIADLNRRLSTEQDPSGRSDLLDRLWETELRSLQFRDPESVAAAKPVPLRQLQKRLHDGEMLIEYVLGRSHSFAFSITRDEAVPYVLEDRKEVETAVARHLQAIQARRDGRAEGAAVYRLLLAPIPRLTQYKRLIIVADGRLNTAALGAAVNPEGRYLMQTHVVSYAPSAAVYCILSSPKPAPRERVQLLAIGGVSYRSPYSGAQSVVRAGGLFNALAPPQFSPLRRSSSEVADLANSGSWNATLLTGDSATEAGLKHLPLGTYDVLHFALHSAIDHDFPDRSGLVLTSQGNTQNDDLLQAREIMPLKLNADLVTLSACDGAAGTPEGIAGTNSLVQAFLMAGARSVVASIWEADDTFTAALMRRFYGKLRLGYDKAEALAIAKRELLSQYGPNAIPLYWAGFRIVGDAHGTISGGRH